MNINFTILIFCVIFISVDYAAGRHPMYYEAAIKCLKIYKVDGKLVKDIFYKPEGESDDPTVRCFFKCFSEEVKWMDVISEELVVDAPRVSFDPITAKIMNTCAAAVKYPDPCDRSYFFYKCITKMKSEYRAANPDAFKATPEPK